MTKELLVSLDWREISNGTNYMYGTKINFQDGKVLMDNPQIAPGKPLRTFVSRTNYQGNRRSPELPLLIPKRAYYLEVVAEAEPLQHFFVEMIFTIVTMRLWGTLFLEKVMESLPVLKKFILILLF